VRPLEFIIEKKIPKGFHLATILMMTEYPPTDRYILWIISKAPYAFNIAYWGQFVQKNPSMANQDSKFGKALEALRTLKIRGLIKQRKNQNWKITLKGKLFRFTTHPQFILFQIGLPIIVAISIAIIVNHKPSPIKSIPKVVPSVIRLDSSITKKKK
jgi:hypothetical protein